MKTSFALMMVLLVGLAVWTPAQERPAAGRPGSGTDSNTVYNIALEAANAVGGPTNGITQTTASAMMAAGTNTFAGDAGGLTNVLSPVYLVRASDGKSVAYATIELAAAASAPFDEIRASGYQVVSNAVPIPSSVRMNIAGAFVVNRVPYLGTNGPCFVLTGTNASLTGPGVIYNDFMRRGPDATGYSYQASFGVLESGLGTSRLGYGGATNFVVQAITSYGETDVAFFRSTNLCSGIIRDCTFGSRWDSLLIAEGAHKITFQNCNLTAIGTNQITGNTDRSYAATFDTAPGAEITWIGCNLTVSNALTAIVNSDTGGATTNRFINCKFSNLYTSGTDDFVVDGGVGASLYFDNCTGLRPSYINDLFAGGASIHYGTAAASKLVFGGDALNGDGPTITNSGTVVYTTGTPATSGNYTGSGSGLTNINNNIKVYKTGSAVLTNASYETVDFYGGSGQVKVTIPVAGTYLIMALCDLEMVNSPFAGEEILFKLRKTSGTPADIANAARTCRYPTDATTAWTFGPVALPPVTYVATASDVIELQYQNATAIANGISTSAEIVAIRIAP